MSFFTNRESKFWKIYDGCSALAGVISVFVVSGWFVANITTIFEPSLPDFVQLVQKWFMALMPFSTSTILFIVFLDILKFKATKDPRDEPGRKWWSIKSSGKYFPNEIVILPDDIAALRTEALNIHLSTYSQINCPKCDVTHAFQKGEIGPRICLFYGCKESVPSPIDSPK